MKKNKFLLIVLLFIIIGCLCSCANMPWNSLNLSQYSDHGKMINGLMWVEKEEDGWKEGKIKYNAFIDKKGNVISKWYKTSLGDSVNGLYFDAEKFQYDILDGFILIKIGKMFREPDVIILNNKGEEIVKDLEFYFISQGPAKVNIIEYSVIDDYFFFKEKRFNNNEEHNSDSVDFYLCCVDKHGQITRFDDSVFTKDEGNVYREASFSVHDLKRIDHKDKKFFMESNGIAWIFDENGNCLFDFYENVKDFVPESVNYDINGNIECIFKGKDENKYKCVIDFNGNFIEEPVKD